MTKALKILLKNLNDAVEARGWKQRTLSEKSGIPYATVNKYLGGKMEPSVRAIERMATELGVSIAQLFTDEKGADSPFALSDDEILSRAGQILAKRAKASGRSWPPSPDDLLRVLAGEDLRRR